MLVGVNILLQVASQQQDLYLKDIAPDIIYLG